MSFRTRIVLLFTIVLCSLGLLWRYSSTYLKTYRAPRPASWNDTQSETQYFCSGLSKKYGGNSNNCTRQYSRHIIGATPTLLCLSMTLNLESWGSHIVFRRNVDDFLHMLSQQMPPENISLGLLTSSIEEYNTYIEATSNYNFAKVSVILHYGYDDDRQMTDRAHRQDKAVQLGRRSELAKLRNFLMLKTIAREEHILWTDADVYHMDEGIVQRILRHAMAQDKFGLITARCSQGGNDNYDHNAWRGTRQGPRGWDLDPQEIADGELDKQGQQHIPKIILGSGNDDLLELDVVGATVLYLRASLIWQGLTFPPQFAIGTRWQKDGWDGIESEGLCYNARYMTGGRCAVMGGSWHIEHTKK